MPAVFDNAAVFVISTIFDLYTTLLMVRLILALVHANYFDPITQFIAKLTNPIIKPLRKILPNIRNLEISTVCVIVLLEIIKFTFIILLTYGMANIVGLIVLSLGDGIKLFLQIFFYAIIIQALLSFIQPYSPFNQSLRAVTQPILQPFQRIIPLISGIDISPIPALLTLQLLILLIATPIITFGVGMAVT